MSPDTLPDYTTLTLGEMLMRLLFFAGGAVIGGFLCGAAVWSIMRVETEEWRAAFQRETRLRAQDRYNRAGQLDQPFRAAPLPSKPLVRKPSMWRRLLRVAQEELRP